MIKKLSLYLLILCSACQIRQQHTLVPENISEKGDSIWAAFNKTNTNQDTLYIKTAAFLYQHMKYHSFAGNPRLHEYVAFVNKFSGFPNAIEKEFAAKNAGVFKEQGRVYDVNIIDTGYLRDNLERSLDVFNRTAWKKDISFDIFCNYVLSYRVADEPVEVVNWKEEVGNTFFTCAGDMILRSNLNDAVAFMYRWMGDCQQNFRYKFGAAALNIPLLPVRSTMKTPVGSCREFSHKTVAILRSVGIPAAIDFTPNYCNINSDHQWAAIITDSLHCLPFDIATKQLGVYKDASFILSKVYRHAFAANMNSHLARWGEKDYLPDHFNNPSLIDVTSQYTSTLNIKVPVYKEVDQQIAYLAVFNRPDWMPVDWGTCNKDSVAFNNIGLGGVYLPVSFTDEKQMYSVGDAFILGKDSVIHYCKPDLVHTQTVNLYRKYPPDVARDVAGLIMRAKGGKFQGANKRDFSDAVDLYEITGTPQDTLYVVPVNNKSRFRYVRYLSPQSSYGNLAEAEFYEKGDEQHRLKGPVLGTEGSFMNNPLCVKAALFDGNYLTYFDTYQADYSWAGMDLGEKKEIGMIRFLVRTDLNGIVKGNTYDLLYWDKEWKSLGKVASPTNGVLQYNNVPSNAILWLRNLTTGREERIFTYENGKQVWR